MLMFALLPVSKSDDILDRRSGSKRIRPNDKESPMGNAERISDRGGTLSVSPSATKTVIVVDDDPGFRELIASILRKAGYLVDQAADGSEAIVLARTGRIDLLITDIVMPNREGIETIQYFSKALPKVPIVAVSGAKSYLRPAKALGAAATLEKTSVAADILQVVRSIIGE
jgi:CheY-like chemotaxis protein